MDAPGEVAAPELGRARVELPARLGVARVEGRWTADPARVEGVRAVPRSAERGVRLGSAEDGRLTGASRVVVAAATGLRPTVGVLARVPAVPLRAAPALADGRAVRDTPSAPDRDTPSARVVERVVERVAPDPAAVRDAPLLDPTPVVGMRRFTELTPSGREFTAPATAVLDAAVGEAVGRR